jgi:hypothetical protein
VQLTSGRGAAVLEHVKGIGVEHKLHMLPVLKKPYETEAVVKVIQDLKLGLAAATAKIDIEQALANNWIEFWYQPKIAPSATRHPAAGCVHGRRPGSERRQIVRAGLGERARNRRHVFQARRQYSAHGQIFIPRSWTSCRSPTS